MRLGFVGGFGLLFLRFACFSGFVVLLICCIVSGSFCGLR